MAEVYVTLGEAAELEGVKYKTMAQRLSRKKESFVTKTEKSETGGKDVVLVAVSSLSKQARNAWKEREKLKSFTEEFPDKKEDEQKPEVPWYVNTDVDWYIENYKERYYKAVELGNVVRKFLQYDEGDRTKYAEEFAQKYLGKGQRTLYRYTKAYLEASAWADKLEKEDGAGREFFKVLCLCRKPKETGCFPSIKPEVKQVIKNIWFNEDFARNQGTREMLYEKLTAMRKSVGIGSQISQISGVYYPTRIDNYCKIVKGMKYYGRYMDDIYIIHEDKEYLKGLLNDIQGICDELGLFINPKKTQIVKLSHGFTFLKIKYNLTETGKVQERISKDSVTRMRRKLKKFRKLMDAGEMSFDDVRCAYASWKGGVSHYDSYNVVKSMDKLFDELFIHPFIGGGHRDEQNNNEQK